MVLWFKSRRFRVQIYIRFFKLANVRLRAIDFYLQLLVVVNTESLHYM